MKAIQIRNYIKGTSKLNRTGLLSAFAIFLLALACLYPLSKSEQTTEAVTGTAQSSSLTLDVTSASASVDLEVSSTNGTFAASNVDAAFSVSTNNFSGYTLSIVGSDDNGLLLSTNGAATLSSLTEATTEASFSAAEGTALNGKWGYKPSKLNSQTNTNYLPAPTTTASTLDVTAAANSTTNNYTIALGARTDYNTPSATYSNTFIITAVPNAVAYQITYDANTAETVTNMPFTQASSTSATSITLSSNTPARDGYDFLGWCTTKLTDTTPETCTGTTFQPANIFGIDQTTSNVTTLYAIWKKQGPDGTMQNFSTDYCKEYASSEDYTLTDLRDQNAYTVRFISGLCWMTQNLNYDLATNNSLSPTTSNVPSAVNSLSVGTSNSFSSSNYASNIRMYNGSGYYNYCAATAGEVCSSAAGSEATQSICPAGWRLPTMAEQTTLINHYTEFNPVLGGYFNTTGTAPTDTSYGYYWSSSLYTSNTYRRVLRATSSALAMNYVYKYRGANIRCIHDYTPGKTTIIFNGNGNLGGSMSNQIITNGSTTNLTANGFTAQNGYEFASWNTAADGSGTPYRAGDTYEAAPGLASETITLYAQWGINYLDDVTYMQDLTSAQCTNSYDGATAALKDRRDKKSYTVAKINGICTMTKNLALTKTSTLVVLTPEDSNVTNNYTIPDESTSYFAGYGYETAGVKCSTATYGCYYNYCAATAGEICNSLSETNINEATQSICPKGWRLPTGAKGGEQDILNNNWDSWNDSYPAELNLVRAGYYNGADLSGLYSYGRFWSSSANSTDKRYAMNHANVNGDRLISGVGFSRSMGISVRCVVE